MGRPVLVGMSGGVDSSVAAFLLKKQGYNVTGVTLRLCEDYSESYDSENVMMAKSVADKLGIDFITIDYRDEFRERVISYFVEAYEKGMTPNPCIECNRYIKFDLLMNDSDEGYESNMENAPLVATGHYAVIEHVNGRYKLRKSTNLLKDQSYFLYTLTQDTLSRVVFPLGEMGKDDVRAIAEENGLVTAHRRDSQDICFVPDGDYAGFIEDYTGSTYPEGNFVDTSGNVLGRHKGIIHYTVGQRKGLGLSLKKPMYVLRLDMEKNEVVLADDSELFSAEIRADQFNWVSVDRPDAPFRALGRIRYRHKEAPCTVTANEDGTVSVVFDEPQRAATAGQSLVLYDIETDSYVLGGGRIIF